MRRLLLLCALLLSPLIVMGQVYSPLTNPITTSGNTISIPNLYGGFNASFEEIIAGSPVSVSITIQGCMRGGTCDSAADTNTSTSASIRFVTFSKAYSSFLVTATWSGGSNVNVQVNPFISTARSGSGGGGGGSVSSVGLSAPGPLFSVSGSPVTGSGTLSFSYGTIGAHLFLGNNTGLSALAALVQPACGDLSNAAASCSTDTTNATNISSGTVNNLRLPSSISISGSVTASSFSGTGNAFSGTEAASSSIACASTLDILWADSGAHRWKMCNNNGTADTVAGLADIANQVTAASSATAAKQTCVASGASKTCSYISFPDAKIIPFAAAPGGTAVSGVTYASGQWTPTLRAGTNNIGAALQAIPSTGASLQFVFELPGDWDTTQQPFISIYYGSGANTTGTVIWTVSSACSKADGSVTDDPTFVAETAFASQTMAVANRYWAKSGQYTAITSGNSCIPGSPVLIKVALSGTASSAINAEKAVITVPRLLTVQAN